MVNVVNVIKKSAIVTGSTSGIGLAIASKFAADGCNVMLNGFGKADEIEQIRKDLQAKSSAKILYSPADMSKPDEIAKMISTAEKEFGRLDILVNNAGIQFVAPIEEFPVEKWQQIIDINLSAAFHAMRAAVAGMKKRNFGRIINIASAHGLVGSANKSAYVSAKHGIMGLTKVVALETATYNITVNAICPGWVDTPLVRKQIEDNAAKYSISKEQAEKKLLDAKQPSERFVKTDDIAALTAFLCGENSSSITGTGISIDGGWTAE